MARASLFFERAQPPGMQKMSRVELEECVGEKQVLEVRFISALCWWPRFYSLRNLKHDDICRRINRHVVSIGPFGTDAGRTPRRSGLGEVGLYLEVSCLASSNFCLVHCPT